PAATSWSSSATGSRGPAAPPSASRDSKIASEWSEHGGIAAPRDGMIPLTRSETHHLLSYTASPDREVRLSSKKSSSEKGPRNPTTLTPPSEPPASGPA